MTVLIKNALIFDGSGKLPFKSDIFINHERINRLGNFPHQSADKVIDARGAMTTPGFIDINADADHYLTLFSDPGQSELLKHGITTIIGGNAGSSLAPLIDGSLRSIRKWADSSQVNVNWRSVFEFLKIMKRRKLGVNFGTLIGHSTIRRAIIGEDLRDLTEKEIKVFKYVLEEGLKEGAFGFSTGLSYVHSHNVSKWEIEELVKITAKFKGVYATQLRNYSEGLAWAINETLNLARKTGANVEISRFQPLKEFGNDYLEIASLIEKEKMRAHIHFDIFPAEANLMDIYMFLPEWARSGGLEVMLQNIKTPSIRERILIFFDQIKFEDLIIAKVPSFLKFIEGKSLTQFSEAQNLAPTEALLKLMELTQLKAELWYKNIDFQTLSQLLISENAIIASGGSVKFLNLVQEKNLMPLEKAVIKATSSPARKFNIRERGLLAEGYFADIVIMRDGQPSDVLVNGSVVLENGEINGSLALAGKVLKHSF
ncbi:MAG: amidohydrolase family protein [bacterium]|nr:amidohydrolase family protein [bacterium]